MMSLKFHVTEDEKGVITPMLNDRLPLVSHFPFLDSGHKNIYSIRLL